MTLSIITINYNNLAGLKRTVPTVVGQTYQNFEYIVIDGGSTDGSKEYIEEQPRTDYWVSEPDKGIYNAMNKAIGKARGDYCLFMNSGDMFFSPVVLEACVPLLKGADFYAGGAIFVKGLKAEIWLPPEKMTASYIMTNSLCHQSLFCKTSVMRERPFNEGRRIVADWEQFIISWYTHNCSYESIQAIVSTYFMDGISSTNQSLSNQERADVIREIFGKNKSEKNYRKAIDKIKRDGKAELREGRLQKKLRLAMSLKPVARDWKIARNGIKFLFKDLFNL